MSGNEFREPLSCASEMDLHSVNGDSKRPGDFAITQAIDFIQHKYTSEVLRQLEQRVPRLFEAQAGISRKAGINGQFIGPLIQNVVIHQHRRVSI